MTKCVISEYETSMAAKVALELLETNDFTLRDVSVVSSVSDPSAIQIHHLEESHHEHASPSAPEGKSVSLGMLIGGTVATPILAGTLVGPFVIAGPLVGIAIGAAVGSLLSNTDRWGVHRDVSADYEQRVESGSVLVIVNAEQESRLSEAERILKTTDPKSLGRFESSQD
ncbi:MAG: DUF1269 domain-containing protein [Pirellulaceae bacterium]|nr:DUF1269 domain-containing protein [Pirellulaceae bacterium]